MAAAKMGRPTVFTPDTKDLLLDYFAAGYPVRDACRMLGVEPQNFYYTLGRDPEFNERYEAAKAAAVDALVHDGEDYVVQAMTADAGHKVQAAKNAADYKFRMASRIAPTKWGEKAQVHVTGSLSEDPQEVAKRLAFLEALNGNGPGGEAEPVDDGSDLA